MATILGGTGKNVEGALCRWCCEEWLLNEVFGLGRVLIPYGLILANLKESDQPAAVCIQCERGWEGDYARLIQSFDKDGLVGARASDDVLERSGAEFDGRFFGFDDLLDDGVG